MDASGKVIESLSMIGASSWVACESEIKSIVVKDKRENLSVFIRKLL